MSPTLAPSQRLKVLVAMSGGVDSSYAAAVLAGQGHEVIGVTLRVWQDKNPAFAKDACSTDTAAMSKRSRSCCGAQDMSDAGAVARSQGFPHYVLDYEDRFRADVIDGFVAEYLAGRTPNPCVACNDKLKFGPLLQAAQGMDCAKLATGHYARLTEDASGAFHLFRARDLGKDQTYFLYKLTQPQLSRLLFPLGELKKAEVRKESQGMGLPTADKTESMDICFVPRGDYGQVLKAYAPESQKPGPVVDEAGKVLGEHEGLAFFTVGQRKGLGIGGGEALYVLGLDRARNAVVVGPETGLMRRRAVGSGASFTSQPLSQPSEPFRCRVKIRSSHLGAAAVVSPLGGGRWSMLFDEPQRAITPGQAAVFYGDDDECLGGLTLDESGH
ncbi:MAG TPA: tRNA 2-thiouridine(34) synthase MnmA [bacterium]|nr:tRNA 2-thiouridine(34) synthase MnmA [bacterium]